jgi:hypothetical protein
MICIVDDDESVLEAIKCLVRSLGYNTVTFSSAEEFLDSGPMEGMECLITDVQMPGLSGTERARASGPSDLRWFSDAGDFRYRSPGRETAGTRAQGRGDRLPEQAVP